MMKYLWVFALLWLSFDFAKEVTAQSNLQIFTPSILLPKGQLEFNQFNSLYSQTKSRDKNGNKINLGERQSFLRNRFDLLYGISASRRLNVGIEANIVTAKYNLSTSSIFSIFSSKNTTFKRTFLSSFGPKIKFTPLKKFGFLSIQSTLLFPLSNNLESPRFVDHERINWITQVFFDKSVDKHWRIFLEVGILYRFKKLEQHNAFFRAPLSAILSYFPSPDISFFGGIQHAPAFGQLKSDSTSKFGQIRWFSTLGIGAKYQITNEVGLELSYNNFVLSRNDGAGSSINLGLRVIK